MPSQTPPDLGKACTTLARNVARVNASVDLLANQVDEILKATTQKDWPRVGELSQQVAEQGRALGYRAISARADQVHQQIARSGSETGVRQSLVRLIGACHHMERPKNVQE